MQFKPQKAFDIPQQILYQIGGGSSHDVYTAEGAKVTHLNAYLSVTQGDIGRERAQSVLRTNKSTQTFLSPRFMN